MAGTPAMKKNKLKLLFNSFFKVFLREKNPNNYLTLY